MKKRNALIDRIGEHPSDEWVDVPGAKIRHDGGRQWSVTLPFLMPGSHIFRVFPDTGGTTLLNTINLEVTSKTAYWPPIRALIIVILIVLIIGVIRRRI